MVQVEKRTLDITTRVRDQLTKPFRRMGKGIASFAKTTAARLRSVKAALFSLKGAVVGLAVVFGARRLFAGIKSTADELDEIVKTSQRVGVTVEALQELKFVAALAGTELGQLTAGLVVFSKNVEQARQGVVLKKDALDALGLSYADVEGETLDIIGILQKVSKAWNESTSATERNNAIAELFGRTGSKLGPILEAGAAGIAAQAKQARELGAVFSREELDRAAEFNDALLRLTVTMKAIAEAVFIEVAPLLSQAFDEVRKFVVKNKDSIKESLIDLSRSLADFALFAAENLGLFADAFQVALGAAGTFIEGLTFATLQGVKLFKKFSGGTVAELAVVDRALLKSSEKIHANANATAVSFERAMAKIRAQARETRESIDALAKGPEKATPQQQGKPVLVEAAEQESEKFKLIIQDLEVRQLQGYKRQIAAVTLRYDSEKVRIEERAAALKATDEQRRLALELLDAEFADTTDRLEGGFFSAMGRGFGEMVTGLQDATAAGRLFATEVGGAIAREGLGAINDWVDGTKTLKQAWSDLGDAIIAELQRIIVKTLILRTIGGVFSFAGDLFGEGKAKGGITPPIKAPVKLKQYATGGIARGPQFALFGEGGGAEAFVPLPDGRSIPVTMRGGGGGAAVIVINNISALDGRSVAAFLEANSKQLTAIYDRALITRAASRGRVRGVR